MSDDRGLYADIVSNGAGGIMASIEGQTYGPGVPSLDPGLQAGDSVPVGFMHPGSSRQPLLLARRPILKEISQGVLNHFLRNIPTFIGFAHWIQTEGSWGCPDGITLPGRATVWDKTALVNWGYKNRYTGSAGPSQGYQTPNLADTNDVVGLVAFNQAGSFRLGALLAIWDGQPADGYSGTGTSPITTASDVVIREYTAVGTYNDYSLAPLGAVQQKAGVGFLATVGGQRNRRGGWLFVDLLSDTTGVYVACLQDQIYFLRRSDHHVFRAAYPNDVARNWPVLAGATPAYTLLPTSLRTGSYCMFGGWILDGSYLDYNNSTTINSSWTADPNPNSLTFDMSVLVAPNHSNRGQVWAGIRALDFTLDWRSIDLKVLVANLVRSLGCGIQASLWNNLPATRFPILWDELSDPANPRHEAIHWFSGIDTSGNSHFVTAKIELSTRTLTSIEDRVAPQTYPLQYPTMRSDADTWWSAEATSSRVPYRSGIDDGPLSLNPSGAYPSATYPVNLDGDLVPSGPNAGQKASDVTQVAAHFLTVHGNTVSEDCHDHSAHRGYDLTGYDSSALAATPGNAAFCIPHPFPGDHTEDDIADIIFNPGSAFSPSGTIGQQQNHYSIHSEPDLLVAAIVPGGAVTGHTALFRLTDSFIPATPDGAINVGLNPAGIDTYTYAYTPCRNYESPAGIGKLWTTGTRLLTPTTKRIYRTYLTKRNLDLSIAWRIDITDYYSWAGVAGTTTPWVTIPAVNYPHCPCRWAIQECGAFVFVIAQHAWKNISLLPVRTLDGPTDLANRDTYLDVYQASDGQLVGRESLRIPSDATSRAYTLWVPPAFVDGYPPRMRCEVNSLGQSIAEINMAWRPNSGDGGPGTTGDVWSRIVLTWGSTSSTTSGVISRVDVPYGADNAAGFLSVGYPIQSDSENRILTQQSGSFWMGPAAGQGDTIYQQPPV